MQTLILRMGPDWTTADESRKALDQAVAILRGGGTVALPTETVYGLAANALDPQAVAKIFTAKQRPTWDPLIVHVSDPAMFAPVVAEVPEEAKQLIAAFWPGPLTLLLPRSAIIPDEVTAGRPLVAVRMPAHPVALELIRRAGIPLAAPSANRFGHTSPTTAAHVLDDLEGRIDAVLDAGPTAFGVESTVLDPCQSPMIVYRPGAVTLEQIRAVAGPAEFFIAPASAQQPAALPSPGVGLRHYAPRAELVQVDLANGSAAQLHERAAQFPSQRVGIMLPSGLLNSPSPWPPGPWPPGTEIFDWGPWADPEELAHRLFAGLRHLDARGCQVILCPVPPEQGIGAAIRDRLRKASFPDSGSSEEG